MVPAPLNYMNSDNLTGSTTTADVDSVPWFTWNVDLNTVSECEYETYIPFKIINGKCVVIEEKRLKEV